MPTATRRWPRDLLGLVLIAVAGAAGYVLFPDNLAFLTRVISIALLVLSLDLLTGYCGIASLGQGLLYGAGAYAAGIAAVNGIGDPVLLLLVGAVAGSITGVLSGVILLRAHGLPQLVLSIALVQLGHEAANKAAWLTGGSDGLYGISPNALVGMFEFDLYGRTGYVLGLIVLGLVFLTLSLLVRTPFGMTCRGIKEDAVRIGAMGIRVKPTLLKMFAVSGAVAGLGGALGAIATQVVGLDSVSFEISANALVMLVIGGLGNLYGALIGTVMFLSVEHVVSAFNPFHWMTLVGLMLIAVVLFAPRGLTGIVKQIASRRGDTSMTELFRIENLRKQFGGLAVTNNVSLTLSAGDRLALIGPNGAGKTTLINLVTGHLDPSGGRVVLVGEDVTKASPVARVRKGLVRTFQITRLFSEMTPEEHVTLAVLQRKGRATRLLERFGSDSAVADETAEILATLGLTDMARIPVARIAYGQQRLLEIALALALRPRVLLLDEPAAGVPSTDTPRIEAALERLPPDLAVLMIEHDMDLVFRFARHVTVLAAGEIIYSGSPEAVTDDARVREAYLGSYADARRVA